MAESFGKLTVRAQYKFKASNNDELTFKKGELITVTQKEDGGWWEGTSHETGKTGWFPSNYVKEVDDSVVAAASTVAVIKVDTAQDILAKQIDYRQQVIKDLIEKEREFVSDIETLQTNFLEPLKRSEIFSESEYYQLVGNTEEIRDVHRCMHVALQDAAALDGNPRDQRVGRVLLNHGSNIRAAHLAYWANHPRAVCILEKYRTELDTFMEGHGASKPGLMVLTTSLSRPLRHLEKYAGNAQELEQHLEDDHPDRGDTQRSVGFYKNVASDCAKIRRQKELELEVLTGIIRDWEGDEKISHLGEILHMGSVAVGSDHKDRYFVLFPSTLLILSVSARMSAFIYEGKLPLSGISVNRLEDIETVKNSFEITGPMIDRIFVVCQTKQESLKWVEVLRNQIKACRQTTTSASSLPQPPQQLPFHKPNIASPAVQKRNTVAAAQGTSTWKMSCLRPAPPTRHYLGSTLDNAPGNRRSINVNKKLTKDPETTYDDDMQILRVIEAYCWTKNQRQTIAPTSTFIENLPILSDEDKSPSHEDNPHNISDERAIHETIRTIQDQLVQLRDQNRNLQRRLDEETNARRRLESNLRNNNIIVQTFDSE